MCVNNMYLAENENWSMGFIAFIKNRISFFFSFLFGVKFDPERFAQIK